MRKLRFAEVPITFSNGKWGKSKLFKVEFISFLTYVIKTEFGVTVQEENEKVETKAFLNASNWDEGCKDLSINTGTSVAFRLGAPIN